MRTIDYIRNETLDLGLFCSRSPVLDGAEIVGRLLDTFAALPPALRPQQAVLGRKQVRFEREAVAKLLMGKASALKTILNLERTDPPESLFSLSFVQPGWEVEFWLRMYAPYSLIADEAAAHELAGAIQQLVRDVNKVSPVVYGYCHTKGDFSLAKDPHNDDPAASKRVYGAYWLNVLGNGIVKDVGRERVLATPCASLEQLQGGAVMFLTTPDPADVLSDTARSAQAKAFVHLRPDLTYDAVLDELRRRSRQLAPADRDWDPDLAPVLALLLDDLAFAERESATRRFNAIRPLEPRTWLPVAQMPTSDLADQEAEVAAYHGRFAEQFVALMHRPVPEAGRFELSCLPKVDRYFWVADFPARFARKDIEDDLVPALGAWLGKMLVVNLGGVWRPRRNLMESGVIAGPRVWLTFQHARQYLRSREAVLEHSLTKFVRVVERSAQGG